MKKRTKPATSPNAYEEQFHKLMESQMAKGVSLENRIRQLVFSIVDESCPLHRYLDKPPSVSRVSFLTGELEHQSSPVRDAMFKLSGRLGILSQTSGQVKLRVAVPEREEAQAISDLRFELERFALLRLHKLETLDRRKSVLINLQVANDSMEAVGKLRASFGSERELELAFSRSPELAEHVDNFWRQDIEFHTIPAHETASHVGVELLHILLERMRIGASNRLRILERIPTSVSEHQRIIDAVAKSPSPGSEVEIEEALRDHLDSSNSYFQIQP